MDKYRIHEMLEKMTEWCLSEMGKGVECVNTDEMGKAIDMVKDLACAEKDVWEKCYYKSIVEAMEGAEEERKSYGMDRAGYDRWRYGSGRFAPTGRGHETSMATATGRPGFTDPKRMPPWYMEPWAEYDGRMGYTEPGMFSDGSRMGKPATGDVRTDGTESRNEPSRRQQYEEARRHFTQSGEMADKTKRDQKAKEYVYEAVDTMRDIFQESDPRLQEDIKNDLKKLMREFGM